MGVARGRLRFWTREVGAVVWRSGSQGGGYGSKAGSGRRGSLWGQRLPGSRPLVISVVGMSYRKTRAPHGLHITITRAPFKTSLPRTPPHGAYLDCVSRVVGGPIPLLSRLVWSASSLSRCCSRACLRAQAFSNIHGEEEGKSGGLSPSQLSRPAPAIFQLCGLGTRQFVAPRSTLPGIPGFREPSLLRPHVPAAAQGLALTGADVPALLPWVSADSDGEWCFLGPVGPRLPGRHQGMWALTRPSGLTSGGQFLREGQPPLRGFWALSERHLPARAAKPDPSL